MFIDMLLKSTLDLQAKPAVGGCTLLFGTQFGKLGTRQIWRSRSGEVTKRSRFEVPQVSPSWRQVRSRLNPVQHEPCSFVRKVCRPRLASQPMLVRQIRSVWAICLKLWEWKQELVIGVPSHSESLFFDPDWLVATLHGCMLLHALQARRVSSLWITPAVPAKCMSFSWSGRDFGRFGSDDGLEESGISVIRSLSLAAAAVTLAMRQKRPTWKYRFSDQRPAVQDIRRYQFQIICYDLLYTVIHHVVMGLDFKSFFAFARLRLSSCSHEVCSLPKQEWTLLGPQKISNLFESLESSRWKESGAVARRGLFDGMEVHLRYLSFSCFVKSVWARLASYLLLAVFCRAVGLVVPIPMMSRKTFLSNNNRRIWSGSCKNNCRGRRDQKDPKNFSLLSLVSPILQLSFHFLSNQAQPPSRTDWKGGWRSETTNGGEKIQLK